MISSILQYSTIDYRFLETNLKQLSKFSDEIIVVVCDHFFNGEPEDNALLDSSYKIISEFSKCKVYQFEWEGDRLNTGYYHNMSREIGRQMSTGDWLLFIDADEIIDDEFKTWFETEAQFTSLTYWLTCYWYFREPIYQSTTYEGCGLLIKKDNCNFDVNIRDERQQLLRQSNVVNGQYNHILYNNKPMMHHFSWVRTKEDMIKKVKNWGHKNDINWLDLIEEEFSRPFNGKDFVHKYEYNTVQNKFNL